MATLTTAAAKTHKLQILHHLRANNFITDFEARETYGCTRVAARVNDLRRQGVEIKTKMIQFINRNGHRGRYAQYWIEKEETKTIQQHDAATTKTN